MLVTSLNFPHTEYMYKDNDRTVGPQCYLEGQDPELFFPEGAGKKLQEEEAKAVCGRCAVRLACAAYALDNDISHGVWGGLSEQERRSIRRRQKRSPWNLDQ